MSGTAVEATQKSRRRGSDFTDKQIAHAVKDGRAVQITTLTGDTPTGFVFGMDDYHWGLVTLSGSRIMVHKSAPSVEFTEFLLEAQTEQVRSLIDPIVSGFRARVMRDVFHSNPATT